MKEAKDELAEKNEEIARLQKELEKVQSAKVQVQNQYEEQIAKLRNGYQVEIQKAINEAEKHKDESAQKDMVIERQKAKIDELDKSPTRNVTAFLLERNLSITLYPTMTIRVFTFGRESGMKSMTQGLI